MNPTMKRCYSIAFVSLILSPPAWFAASAFQTSRVSNRRNPDAPIAMMASTSAKESGRQEGGTPIATSSRRRALEAYFAGGIATAAAVASSIRNPLPANAVCCHNKRQTTSRDKRAQRELLLRQFRLLPRRDDIVQVGTSSPSHRRGIASATLAPTGGGEGMQCALSAGE